MDHETKDTMKQAVFDHVDDNGNLILKVDGDQVSLDVTDTLEHGILSAKQLKSEAQGANMPPEPSTLPISSIQTLVREGHTNAEIAQKYKIEESLVRRFAGPVETEKHYAIAQFLSVNAKTTAATRSMEEVITHNLLESGVEPESVRWEATKVNRQPWKIVARFTRKDKEYKATWMWNLRDNSVVSIDPTAKRLLGESASAGTLLFGEEPANTSSRSIQAALNGRGPVPPAWLNDGKDDDVPVPSVGAPPAAATPIDADTKATTNVNAEESSTPSIIDTDSTQKNGDAGVASESSATGNGHPAEPSASPTASTSSASEPTPTKPAENQEKRKSRRSTVPSWDDILFGD